MKWHCVKINFEYAVEHQSGNKPWELRKNDRDYKVGDCIHFEVMKDGEKIGEYQRKIVYLFEGGKYGLEKDHVIMTISKI